jgi:hypothetical protein
LTLKKYIPASPATAYFPTFFKILFLPAVLVLVANPDPAVRPITDPVFLRFKRLVTTDLPRLATRLTVLPRLDPDLPEELDPPLFPGGKVLKNISVK